MKMNPDLPQTAALGIIFIPKKIKDYSSGKLRLL